jgi:hypothetical protein
MKVGNLLDVIQKAIVAILDPGTHSAKIRSG